MGLPTPFPIVPPAGVVLAMLILEVVKLLSLFPDTHLWASVAHQPACGSFPCWLA